MLVLLSLAVTLGAVLVSSTVAALTCALRREGQARRRAAARADEVALLAAAAQRWRMTPAAWGGAPADAFVGVSFSALGLASSVQPQRRRTDHGVYRLVHAPACATLNLAAGQTGLETGGDGLLVIGWDPATGDDTAVVVLGPLVQVPLARVPWAWIAALDRERQSAATAPLAVAEDAADEGLAVSRFPSRASIAPDRDAIPALRLVYWPERPSRPSIGQAREPPPDPGWRRAA